MIIYDSYVEAGQKLSVKERKEYYTALVELIAFGIEPDLSGAADAVMTAIRPSIETSKKRADSGSKGGHSKQSNSEFASDLLPGKTEANEVANTDFASKQTAYLMNKNSIKDIGIRNKKTLKPKDMNPQESSKDDSPLTPKTSTRFIPPTPEEVQAYAAEKGFDIDAEMFCHFYESKGWMVGKNKMQVWRSAAQGWAARHKAESGGKEAAHHDYSAYDQM